VLKMKENLWTDNLKIVKDILMIYANLIAIEAIVYEKIEGNCFITNFRMQLFRESTGFL